jgi:hypothetical protein
MNAPNPNSPVPELGRIDVCQTARITGFTESEIRHLVVAGHIRPLGHPGPTAPRYFSAVEVRELAASSEWLNKATLEISRHWRQRNERRTHRNPQRSPASTRFFGKTRNLAARAPLSHSH